METSKLPFDKVTSKITEQPLFSENILLKELCDIKITSPNEQKEQENISKTNIQETSDKGSHSDDTIITTLRRPGSIRSSYRTISPIPPRRAFCAGSISRMLPWHRPSLCA